MKYYHRIKESNSEVFGRQSVIWIDSLPPVIQISTTLASPPLLKRCNFGGTCFPQWQFQYHEAHPTKFKHFTLGYSLVDGKFYLPLVLFAPHFRCLYLLAAPMTGKWFAKCPRLPARLVFFWATWGLNGQKWSKDQPERGGSSSGCHIQSNIGDWHMVRQ